MKATIRLPCEQYAFIEIETEVETKEDAVAEYRALAKLYKSGTGLPDKDFNAILDAYSWEEKPLHPEQWEAMNDDQQFIIQVIKRSRKRFNYKTQELRDRNNEKSPIWTTHNTLPAQEAGQKQKTLKKAPKPKS